MPALNGKRIVWAIAGAAVVLVLFLALRRAPVPVEIGTVVVAPFTQSFEEQGKTALNHRYVLAAPIAGTLRRIDLEQGDPVRAGDVVAEVEPSRAALLDPATRMRILAESEAAAAEGRAAAGRSAAAESASALARADLGRMQGMRESGAISAAALDAARSRADQAEANLRAARADRQAALQRRDALAAVLDSQGKSGGSAILLRAPIDGVVLHRHKESAVPVNAGDPLLEFGDPRDLNIEVDTLSQDAVSLTPGMAARVLRWGGDDALEARVTRIEPGGFTKISALGVEEQRTRVRLDFVSPYEQWRRLGDGYRVEVEFVLWHAEKVLQVPSSALFRDNGLWYAYRVEDGRARKVAVDVGHRAATATEVRAGLEASDSVVAHPDDRIDDGVRVTTP
ncbi:MAG: efflux RND transporter periplasmic adaptor subunit [Dokdonella sp.]|nr:efflux RND transporter periplasmic adaptor subunit [Dokdonella sp.]